MDQHRRKKRAGFGICVAIMLLSFSLFGWKIKTANQQSEIKGDADNAGLELPPGFIALKVIEGIGKARHIAVTPKGAIYVKLGRNPSDKKGILYLKDTDGDGRADEQRAIGDYEGTGLLLKNGYLYASSNHDIFRYRLDDQYEVGSSALPDTIVKDLKAGRQHETKSIAIDNSNNLYVNIGSPSNSCQQKNRQQGSLGIPGCPLLDSAGGIWQFKADQLEQSFAQGVRYATGLRNVMGLDWNTQSNSLFVMQHGRDQLHDIFPNLYTVKESAELPAECMYRLQRGDNAGWPFSYYDPFQKKNILSPEYGGDGKKEADPSFINPVVAFPAHLAPNALLFYTGSQFPERYKNGAFVAFHGSWNRAPEKQEGFFVAFVPFENGMPSGDWEIFANGFAGSDTIISTGQARYRPCGLAQGPDGSLYVSDDKRGTIFRIVYKGQ